MTFSPRIESVLTAKLAIAGTGVHDLQAFSSPCPIELDFETLPLRPRTRRVVRDFGHSALRARWSSITFGELFRIRGMGVVSILDFTSTAEAWIASIQRRRHAIEEALLKVVNEEWSEFVSGKDPRFGPPLLLGSSTVYEILDELTAGESRASLDELSRIADVLPEVKTRAEHIAKSPLDQALRELLQAAHVGPARGLEALITRLGWDGKPPVTLQLAGESIGVTRERIRQIQSKILRQLEGLAIYLPPLDKALELVSQQAPISCEEASELLRDKRICSVPFHPRSLLSAAQVCGRSPSFGVERLKDGERVVTDQILRHAARITSLARRQCGRFGVSNIELIGEALSSDGLSIDEETIHECITHHSSSEFLVGSWFWMPDIPPGRNRLENVTTKILAVISPQNIAVVRDGIRRRFQFLKIEVVAPSSVLREFYRRHPSFHLASENEVTPTKPLDKQMVLGETEQVFAEVLHAARSGVLDRDSLQHECVRRGVNASTFGVYTTYSPILDHPAIGVWSLRGSIVTPAAIEAVRRANALRPRERRIIDHRFTENGTLALAARLGSSSLGSLVLGIPADIRRYVAGRSFEATGSNGSRVGTVSIDKKGTSWGYGPFLRKQGADEGDVLIIEFDLSSETAVLSLGGTEALEQFS